MKVLVLGKNGQLGAELVRQCGTAGHEVLAFGRQDLDVGRFDEVETTIGAIRPDVLINATAYNVVPQCEAEPVSAFRVNAIAVKVMAAACQQAGTRFVTYSTDYVFDGRQGTPYREDDRPRPLQVYGVSKYAGEMMARLSNPASLIIRTSGVFGGLSGSPMKGGNFVLSMLREARTKRQLEVSSEQVVGPTFAADLATGTLALLDKDPEGQIYHLTNEGRCSWAEFATAIMEAAGKDMAVIPVDRGGTSDAARRPLFSVLENSRARALGVRLPAWQDAVRRYVRWLAEASGSF